MAPIHNPDQKPFSSGNAVAVRAERADDTNVGHSTDWSVRAALHLANLQSVRRELGVARADLVSHAVAKRLSTALPESRVIASSRWMVEIEASAQDATALPRLLALIKAAVATPLIVDGESCHIKLAIGLVGGPSDVVDEVRLIEEAEDAMMQARADHAPVIRDLSHSVMATNRLTLRRELPAAIERGEMFVQYQPKVHVRRQRIASAEALIRWRHPEFGIIPPAEFIPIAESSRDIGPLTLWTIERVMADQVAMAAHGHDLRIYVNISGELLNDRKFVDQVCAITERGPVRLGFEVTETSVIRDPVAAIANLSTFAERGIEISIDDYGAGLSSLAYLKQLPASELKIDKMFIQKLTSSNRDPLIVRSTIDLAHALEMEVTAEGVETPAALALLSVMGCDLVQGYLISRPVELDAFLRFLDEHKDEPMVDTVRASLRLGAIARSA